MTAPEPDDPLLVLAAEVRDLAATVTESIAELAAARVAAGEAAEVAREVATEAVADASKEARRRYWRLVAVVLLLVAAIGIGFDRYRTSTCERGNDTRAAIVDASGLTVTQTARDLEPLADARARGARVQAEVAKDPRLTPRAC